MPATIHILDDEAAICESVSLMLDKKNWPSSYNCLSSAFLAEYDPKHPAIILLDVNLGDANGIELLPQIIEQSQAPVAVIIMTGFGDIEVAVEAMRRGATDFIEKPIAAERLFEAVERAQNHLNETPESTGPAVDISAIMALSKREQEVVQQLAKGHPNKVVAYELGISPRTVEVHRSRIMKRVGVRSFAELIRLAIAADMV